jgi:decaprenylphospho-beta-D-ribofuranose 2-oxidase
MSDESILAAILKAGDERGLIVRGLGRSYGDAAQRSGGTTLRWRASQAPRWLDRETGLLRCPAGSSIGEVIEFADRDGYFVPVTPGTKHVTIGGALAADVHGKDHHAAGSFGMHVPGFSMMLADGSVVDVDRGSDPDLFHSTVGGMGLTGVILEATIHMTRVPGNQILVDTFRTSDLDATMSALSEAESSHRYSVAWIDLANRKSPGRGVVTNGNHTSERVEEVLGRPIIDVPPFPASSAVNRLTVQAFNEMWFRKAPRSLKQTVQSYDKFFYPLDAVGASYRVYGRRGFLQYQFVMPFESEDLVPRIAAMFANAPSPVSLAVLKRMGERSGGRLSFPIPGWTLAADMPLTASPHELESALRALDEVVVSGGGRVYLAKDSRLAPDLLPEMYPYLQQFRQTRDRVDPHRLFRSDLSERLGL